MSPTGAAVPRPRRTPRAAARGGLLVLLCAASCRPGGPAPEPGVSWALAAHRARTVGDVRYALSLAIPAGLDEPIRGSAEIAFRRTGGGPVILDFTPGADHVLAVRADGAEVAYAVEQEHLVIPLPGRGGAVRLEIDFVAGESSLNRNAEYLYTLFVPDRARTAFPIFDQPNLKAVYQLTLETPEDWQAVANGPLVSRDDADGRSRWVFGPTRPISAYLFAFAAGRFEVVRWAREGRTLTLYHRETDSAKVRDNVETIFRLHAESLDWLEDYTGIPYPFDEFAFVAIPFFQYRGMEHPGAVLYNAARLFLERSATTNDVLDRARTIAHESAHMWFGDLVTMEWFDDVWMKEVFANFMAAKMVNPSFPHVDHDLRFFLAHHPGAYAVDRTAGANPIRQDLANLVDAGTLYGPIIYQKAPVVMQQLELLLGEEPFRDGLRRYLERYRYGNAAWPDLVALLDPLTAEDLRAWSRTWVDEPGRPTVRHTVRTDGDRLTGLAVTQEDPAGRGRLWSQQLEVRLVYPDSTVALPVRLDGPSTEVRVPGALAVPAFVLPGAAGRGYGRFVHEGAGLRALAAAAPGLEPQVARSVAWATLWEPMLYHELAPDEFVDRLLAALPSETEEQVVEQLLGYLSGTFFRFLTPEARAARGPALEDLLWTALSRAPTTSLKTAYFETVARLATTDRALDRLHALWSTEQAAAGLPLTERHHTLLAYEIALRDSARAAPVLRDQLARITDPDRRARFGFVAEALSPDPAARAAFFERLREAANRQQERWVVEAVGYLHHPLRAADAERYIGPSLELLQEIQVTGDIFFPQDWLQATFRGHGSRSAAAIVQDFLAQRPDYPMRLRAMVLREADLLFRAAEAAHAPS